MSKPLSGWEANRLYWHYGPDAIDERGNKDDGYEVYRRKQLEGTWERLWREREKEKDGRP